VLAALDASPSRIPVLVGGCGSGRTTLLQQIKDRLGRTGALYLDVERSATTPERFLKAIAASSPFPMSQPAPASARAAFDTTLEFLTRARNGSGEPVTMLLDEFLELRTFESFPGLRRVLYDLVEGLSASGNRFVLTSRYVARTLRLLRDKSARFDYAGDDGRRHSTSWRESPVNRLTSASAPHRTPTISHGPSRHCPTGGPPTSARWPRNSRRCASRATADRRPAIRLARSLRS
jgi:hypothetical protein